MGEALIWFLPYLRKIQTHSLVGNNLKLEKETLRIADIGPISSSWLQILWRERSETGLIMAIRLHDSYSA